MPEAPVHFVGVCGAGMSALAQYRALGGTPVTGSDRLLDRGETAQTRAALEALGVRVFPQDGSGLSTGTRECVVSTAIEDDNKDLVRARELSVPVVHRADALAREVEARETFAVAGTSGKSTVAGMVFEVLAYVGRDPAVITGAPLGALARKGLVGNAWAGKGPLVIEADESDGTLPKYAPAYGLVLNVGKDHKEVPELLAMFDAFARRCGTCVAGADQPLLKDVARRCSTYGFEGGDLRASDLRADGRGSSFTADGARFELSLPGRYNAENALAAAAVCREAGVPAAASAEALRRFQGVARRFDVVGTSRGTEVVDDYAHNPDKVRAVLAAAKGRGRRVLALFQPHGYAPTRFLKAEFVAAFSEALGPDDMLWVTGIYYAGGTAAKDVSGADIARPAAARGRRARYVEDREKAADEAAAEARPGDVVLVLGARDPSLTDFARGLLRRLEAR
ncbi:MAG: UDP-N-acetylmuramate--alanine ligase [Elusimicrobia bacterium]|nr:UDP-N-acetylmuramate--alanine ligase [Elusimicrobiota bacterium]